MENSSMKELTKQDKPIHNNQNINYLGIGNRMSKLRILPAMLAMILFCRNCLNQDFNKIEKINKIK